MKNALELIHHELNVVLNKPLSREQRKEKSKIIATIIQDAANKSQQAIEKIQLNERDNIVKDRQGKLLLAAITDQCFRTKSKSRLARQLTYLISKYGIPSSLTLFHKFGLFLFKWLGKSLSFILVPITRYFIQKEFSPFVIRSGSNLKRHLSQRKEKEFDCSLNYLGEEILGETEARKRIDLYVGALKSKLVTNLSIKLSSIYSQIDHLSYEENKLVLMQRLTKLYQSAQTDQGNKFINLDMEFYDDLNLTVNVFKEVLSQEQFLTLKAGLALQAYIPESSHYQHELTQWAKERVQRGGAPIAIRLVKGANLAMERVTAAKNGWEQAPYKTKLAVDAHFKQMLEYALIPENAQAVNIAVGSHNVFDIAYSLVLSQENNLSSCVHYEMLEGMAPHVARVLQEVAHNLVMYCPVGFKKNYHNTVAYLMRRLDENTNEQNFLYHALLIDTKSEDWKIEKDKFEASIDFIDQLDTSPRRHQNRQSEATKDISSASTFKNEPNTDFSLKNNQEWVNNIISEWKEKKHVLIPIVVGGKEVKSGLQFSKGVSPNYPSQDCYEYALADQAYAEKAIQTAHDHLKITKKIPLNERSETMFKVAQKFRENRGALIGALCTDVAKPVHESDAEISEAIDFIEYYRRSIKDLLSIEQLHFSPKGVCVIAPPWNFACSILSGNISAALITGNTVIVKPPSESVMVAYNVVSLFWEAGVSKEALQFLPCLDEPTGSFLIQQSKVDFVVLTGATKTAQLFLKMKPRMDLIAECGGKNTIIVTNLADRDQAVKDILASSFGFSGQKCSAASLIICEKNIYKDKAFLNQLKDAVQHLPVGLSWDTHSKIVPLSNITPHKLKRGLSTIDKGEKWLLKPKQDKDNPNLFTPGIKLGVQPGSFMHQTELFGPVIGIMRAENLEHAIKIANATGYGLTAGLESLDENEHVYWQRYINAGNAYINRPITGAIVQRQPFGGLGLSSFGIGLKAGGPNYLIQFMKLKEARLPDEPVYLSNEINILKKINKELSIDPSPNFDEFDVDSESIAEQHDGQGNDATPHSTKSPKSPKSTKNTQTQARHEKPERSKDDIWEASIHSYAFWANQYQQPYDVCQILGQDNIRQFKPYPRVCIRVDEESDEFDILRAIVCASLCGGRVDVSVGKPHPNLQKIVRHPFFRRSRYCLETEEAIIYKLNANKIQRIRQINNPHIDVLQAANEKGVYCAIGPVKSSGRLECLNYLREVVVSNEYHRYGNLGEREGEIRQEVL